MKARKLLILTLIVTLAFSPPLSTLASSTTDSGAIIESYDTTLDDSSGEYPDETSKTELPNESADTDPDNITDTPTTDVQETQSDIETESETDKLVSTPALQTFSGYSATVEGFVQRLYNILLDRNPDPTGYQSWVTKLKAKQVTGAQIISGFVSSNEFQGKNLDDSSYLDYLYAAILDRTPDAVGKANWLDLLQSGLSRQYVLAGMLNSSEFANLCTHYDITKGTGTVTEARDKNANLTKFIQRFYTIILGRAQGSIDKSGLNNWCNLVLTNKATAASAAQGFLASTEFTNKKLSNEAYLEVLYKALFNRNIDSAGKQTWLALLNNGVSRTYILKCLVDSSEFTSLCKQYGITKGSITVTESRDKNVNTTKFVQRFYSLCLGRSSIDANGLNNWTGKLLNGSATGAAIAEGFFFSNEYNGKKTSDSTYIDTLYQVLFGRSADASGKNTYTKLLANGASRKYVLNCFVRSAEFSRVCTQYGITKGSLTLTEARDSNIDVTQFAYYCFSTSLGRTPSVADLNYYTQNINNKSLSIPNFIRGLFNSAEFTGKKLSNTEYVQTLYKTLLRRSADTSGLNNYVARLNAGASRITICNEIMNSTEFKALCKSLNISLLVDGWNQDGGNWYYYTNGKCLSGWQRLNGNRYYFNPANNNARQTGWCYIDGYKYYFNENGILIQNVDSIIGTQSSYYIRVNRAQNCITIYAKDGANGYIIPVKSMICSVGLNGATPLGTFSTARQGLWWTLMGNVYGQYVTRITGGILFHSVYYYTSGNRYTLTEVGYRKLGSNASAGCVRLTVADAKWIYEHCNNGTTVNIYDSSVVGPFDKPTASAPAYRTGYGWYDPTDPNL